MRKAAFAYWNDRIAPVFDNARQIRIVEAEKGCVVTEAEDVLPDDQLVHKATCLVEIDIDTLVCGAYFPAAARGDCCLRHPRDFLLWPGTCARSFKRG